MIMSQIYPIYLEYIFNFNVIILAALNTTLIRRHVDETTVSKNHDARGFRIRTFEIFRKSYF